MPNIITTQDKESLKSNPSENFPQKTKKNIAPF